MNFHIYKGQSSTFMETVTTLGMSLSRILFGWQDHLDTMAWQDVSVTVLPASGSGFGVLVLKKSSWVRVLLGDLEESDCLGWRNQNPKTSPAWLASLVLAGSAQTDQSGLKLLNRTWACDLEEGCFLNSPPCSVVWGRIYLLPPWLHAIKVAEGN